jgi:hypothetical protein
VVALTVVNSVVNVVSSVLSGRGAPSPPAVGVNGVGTVAPTKEKATEARWGAGRAPASATAPLGGVPGFLACSSSLLDCRLLCRRPPS